MAGNQTVVNGDTITYDGEGRQTVATQSGVGTATYSYDGDGKRVQRVINGSTTVYVYDANGLLAAEYSTTAPLTLACTTCFPRDGCIRERANGNGSKREHRRPPRLLAFQGRSLQYHRSPHQHLDRQ